MTRTIALISDSTGNLGEYFVRALMSQFPQENFDLRVFSFIEDKQELGLICDQLAMLEPVIFHTTLSRSIKKTIRNMAKARGWHDYDLTGGGMRFLERSCHLKARPNLKALHKLNQEYDRRIAAINFTVEHDDGLSLKTLQEADIVLMGVSRTSKTPTGIYLANKGYKVANIPIVNGSTFQERIKQYPHLRLVGLTIKPDKLLQVRQRRALQENIPISDYLDPFHIEQELKIAQRLFAELGCPVIDVTHHAIEETAALVLKALHLR